MRISNRGPPDGSQAVSIHVGNQTIDGVRAPDGTLYLASDRIPGTVNSPRGLCDAVSEAEHAGMGKNRPEELVDQIIKDPATAKAKINGLVDRAKTEAEDALRRGDDAIAKRRLEFVAYFNGRSADLDTRMGILDLRARPDVAVREIHEALRSPQVIQSDIFDIINARLN